MSDGIGPAAPRRRVSSLQQFTGAAFQPGRVLGPSSRRVAIVFFGTAGGAVTFKPTPPASLNDGFTIPTSGPFVRLDYDTDGSVVRGEWWAFLSPNTNVGSIIEVLE